MDCNEIRELLEAYALGVLDPEEQAQIELHLNECPECQRLATELIETTSALPQALAEASSARVPPAVKVRLLEAVQSPSPTTSLEVDSDSSAAQEAATDISPHSPQDGISTAAQRDSLLARWLPKWRPRTMVAAVAIILFAISLVWNIRLVGVLAQERAQLAEYADLIGQQEIVLEVIDSEETNRRVLLPPERDSRAYGKVFTRPDMPHVVAMAARLPQPLERQAYHLWVTLENRTRLAGTMNVNEEGFGLLVFDADTDGPNYESARLTLQPEGSTTPSGNPVLVWQASD